MPKYLKQNKAAAQPGKSAALKKAQHTVFWQAGLALLTVILTIVIIFTMTAAWYTNIVQTSGLTFQAEAWGFEGSVNVTGTAIKAAPGDEGVIQLEAENKSESIAAASIIAKVYRDRMMYELEEKYPMYDFKNNKGYGTKKHLEALKKYGPIDEHRRSFKPVLEVMEVK